MIFFIYYYLKWQLQSYFDGKLTCNRKNGAPVATASTKINPFNFTLDKHGQLLDGSWKIFQYVYVQSNIIITIECYFWRFLS